MEKKILPISRQSFRKLQEDNCIYVDKTKYIYELCQHGGMYFLSRPRRFGKSLLLSTIDELYSGSKDLFSATSPLDKDLWILDKWDWTKTSPVIHISFTSVDYEEKGLKEGIKRTLLGFYKNYGFSAPPDASIKILFMDLIKQIHDKLGKVVILIDEYDKPIIDYLEFNKLEQAKANQEILGLFYNGLKDCERYIKLGFISGISQFTKIALSYRLNHLNDLTLDPSYAAMLGYTQEELEHCFSHFIDKALKSMSHYTRQELLDKIHLWYNGYSWNGINRLYNPFDILQFFNNCAFQSYRFEAKIPSFLEKKILAQKIFQLENIETDMLFLQVNRLDKLNLIPLLFDLGYLTIKEKYEYGELVLSCPNELVRQAMLNISITSVPAVN